MENRQIGALTATRGFAAMLVVIFHYGRECFPFNEFDKLFSKGNLAVSYFFTLSGFIMCYTYFGKRTSYVEYLKRRAGRILPLYWFALLLSAVVLLHRHSAHIQNLVEGFRFKLLLNVLLLQAYAPGNALSINSPGWSLSVEMFFYMLFPLLLLLYKRNTRMFILVTIVVFLVSQVSHVILANGWHSGDGARLHDFIYYHPIMHLNGFMVGMCGYHLIGFISKHKWFFPPIVFLALLLLAAVYLPFSRHNGMLAPLCVLMIVSIAVQEKNWLNKKLLVYFGDVSYGIYILQFPLYLILKELNDTYAKIASNAFFYLYILVLVVVSGLSYRYIEKPLRRKINALKV